MADVKDKFGTVVYRIEGNRIIDTYGNWKYEIREENIFDTSGNRKYEIRGDYLFDTYGNRIGETKNLAELLASSEASDNSDLSNNSDISSGNKRPGCLGMIFGFFIRFFHKLSLGGKIGAITGLVIGIVSSFSGEASNVILVAPLAFLAGGGLGAFFGFILRKSSQEGKRGAIIGAGVTALALVIICIIGGSGISLLLSSLFIGIVAGGIVGIIIGNIVGFIKKRVSKKNAN